jgi:membrane associated rhomboid family serine protease
MIPLRDNLRCKLFPFATLVIIALNLLAWFYELMVRSSGAMDQFMYTYCMIPSKVVTAFQSADPTLMLWATISIFTAMFLHGSWMHIIGNMLYLYAFGRGMEARLGRTRFVTFYLLSGLAATLLQLWSDPFSSVPNLGASGAIAGVLGGYILFWPKARVTGIFMFGPFPIPINWPAFIYLVAWFGTQLLSVLGPQVAEGGIAYWAHIGGFLGGLILAGVWKLYQPVSDVCYIPTDCDCPEPAATDDPDDTVDNTKASKD